MSYESKKGVIIWLMIIAISLIVLSCPSLFRMIDPNPSPNLRLDLTQSNTIELYGVPGQEVRFRGRAGESIKGFWAAPDGLTLTIAESEAMPSMDIGGVSATQVSWGDSITVKENENKSRTFFVEGTFTVPESSGTGGALKARLHGDLVYPEYLGPSIYGDFRDKTTNVTIPVEIHTLTRGDLRSETIRQESPSFLIFFGIGAALIGAWVFLFRLFFMRWPWPLRTLWDFVG